MSTSADAGGVPGEQREAVAGGAEQLQRGVRGEGGGGHQAPRRLVVRRVAGHEDPAPRHKPRWYPTIHICVSIYYCLIQIISQPLNKLVIALYFIQLHYDSLNTDVVAALQIRTHVQNDPRRVKILRKIIETKDG